MAGTTNTRTDEDIQREVLRELKGDAAIAPAGIGVDIQSGVATLTGAVDTVSEKWAAERAALRTRGVRAVVNYIEVSLDLSEEQTDVDLARSAVQALESDPLVPDEMVKVSVSGGWITLHGEVDSDDQRQEAERVVRSLTGVKGISDHVTINR